MTDILVSMTSTLNDLAATLSQNLARSGMGKSELADKAGISRITLRHALEGKDFRVSTLLTLADKLGLDVVLAPTSVAAAISAEIRPSEPGPQTPPRTAIGAALAKLNRAPPKP